MVFQRALTSVCLVAVCGCDRGPRVDPRFVVAHDDLMPAAYVCLIYDQADTHYWPTRRADRAYIAFLQSREIHVAFETANAGSYAAFVSFADASRLGALHAEAANAGLEVPTAPLSARIANIQRRDPGR